MKKAVFPGSFDPITIGHYDVIRRAIKLFDEIIIAVSINNEKKYMFSVKERMQFIKEAFKDDPKIKVMHNKGLTINFCKEQNANFILRGIRNPADFEFEKAIAHTNFDLSGIETIFLLTSANTAHISSSIVRDVIRYNGDYTKLVPSTVITNSLNL